MSQLKPQHIFFFLLQSTGAEPIRYKTLIENTSRNFLSDAGSTRHRSPHRKTRATVIGIGRAARQIYRLPSTVSQSPQRGSKSVNSELMRSLTDETATNRKGQSLGAGLYLSASGLNKSRTTRDSEEGNVSVNDGLNTFSVTLCRHRRMVYGSRRQQERNDLFNGVLRKEGR